MTGVINGDGTAPREQFPGIVNPDGTGAPGSTPAGSTAADTVPAHVTPPGGSWYAQIPTETHGTEMPDQNSPSIIEPGPASGYVSTGAGDGGTDHWARHSWQQSPGRAR